MKRAQAGMTLLEVLVAAVIMAIAVVGLFTSLTTSMKSAARLTDYDRGAMLARTKMDELLAQSRLPRMTTLEGRFDPSVTAGMEAGWRARVTPFESLPQPPAGSLAVVRIELAGLVGCRREAQNLHPRGISPGDDPVRRRAASGGAQLSPRRTQSGVTLIELLIAITLVSLLTVGIMFAMRIGLNTLERSNARFIANRRVMGVDRVMHQQLGGFIPVKAECRSAPNQPPAYVPFFHGEPYDDALCLHVLARGCGPRLPACSRIFGDSRRGRAGRTADRQ